MSKGPACLKDAVFYEIYPQSFKDSNGDGIGDLQGIISKLDYVKELGCNALWINPCFDSPFLDGGYDVRDYKKIAPRYGTNEDMKELLDEAHTRGIKVLLDLVPGHTSDQNLWFKESCKIEKNEYSGRYVWTSHAFEGIADHPYICGMAPRSGGYMLNFFASQPALNYGWLNRTEKWMSAVDSPEAIATKEAMKDIMRFWMDMGCDGYRVDMADSLVKNDDENKSATATIWADIRSMMDQDYPECALVSEWSNPWQAINGGGFHMDFYLDHVGNGYNTLLRDYEAHGEEIEAEKTAETEQVSGAARPESKHDNSYFRSDSEHDITRFLNDYMPKYTATKDNGYISMFTCNHDTPRPARTLGPEELKLAYAFILTMPGVPFIYYGDEIGMRYLDVETKEGGYQRTGSRTPMQWGGGASTNEIANLGFSDAEPKDIYLSVDSSAYYIPTVESQVNVPGSLLNVTKELVALRHRYEDLQADGEFEPVQAEKGVLPFVYRRGNMLLALNPSLEQQRFENDLLGGRRIAYKIGEVSLEGNSLRVGPQSFVVLQPLS